METRPKQRRTRVVPRRSEYVTPGPRGGPLSAQWARVVYREALARAGVPWRRPHDLRRGVSTLLHDLGVSAEVRMSIVGHLDASVHRGYVGISDAAKRDALTRLSDALRPS